MTHSTVYLGFCLVSVILQDACVSSVLHSGTSALQFLIAHWFPEDIEFDESCVGEGCPGLKSISLCPNDSAINVLRNITNLMSHCMRGPICGIIIDPRPYKYFKLSMEEFLPGIAIEGNLTNFANDSYTTNISNIYLEMPSKGDHRLPLQVAMLMPDIRTYGSVHMDFRLETVFGPTLTASLTRTTIDIGIEFISTISINKTTNGSNVDIRVVNPVVRARPLICGMDMPSGFPEIHSLITSTMQTIVENSSLAKAIANFMGRLYQSAMQVVSNNCKPLLN